MRATHHVQLASRMNSMTRRLLLDLPASYHAQQLSAVRKPARWQLPQAEGEMEDVSLAPREEWLASSGLLRSFRLPSIEESDSMGCWTRVASSQLTQFSSS